MHACLVVVCRATGYIIAIPTAMQGLSKEEVAELFLEECVFFTAIPCEVLSDNAKSFDNKFVHIVCQIAGIDKHQCLLYSHKTNGRAERAVKIVVESLRLYLRDTNTPTNQW